MRQKATRELFAYWNALRRERAAPDRAEIDPAAIRGILSDAFMIEADREGGFPLRLTGARLNALWLTETKGRSFVDLWGEDGASVAAAIWTVMDGAVPVVMGATAAPADRPALDLELLLLPLRHYGRTHARILGAVAYANHPDWLGLIPGRTAGVAVDADHVGDGCARRPADRPPAAVCAACAAAGAGLASARPAGRIGREAVVSTIAVTSWKPEQIGIATLSPCVSCH